MKALKKWFGETDSEETSSDSDGETEFSRLSRKERNRERKERSEKNKEEKKTNAATKVRKILGIGPIHNESIDFYMKQVKDYSEAKVLALKEYLMHFLKFSQEELDDMEVVETQV